MKLITFITLMTVASGQVLYHNRGEAPIVANTSSLSISYALCNEVQTGGLPYLTVDGSDNNPDPSYFSLSLTYTDPSTTFEFAEYQPVGSNGTPDLSLGSFIESSDLTPVATFNLGFASLGFGEPLVIDKSYKDPFYIAYGFRAVGTSDPYKIGWAKLQLESDELGQNATFMLHEWACEHTLGEIAIPIDSNPGAPEPSVLGLTFLASLSLLSRRKRSAR